MDLQAAWFATHFKQPQPGVTAGLTAAAGVTAPAGVSSGQQAFLTPQPPEAPLLAASESAPVLEVMDQPVRWWQDAAMTFGDVGPSDPARMGDAPAAPRQGFNAFKVGRQALGLLGLHTFVCISFVRN